MKFTFNTGRLYSKEGQIIHVEVADGRVWFNDESRGIAASIPMSTANGTERDVREAVMFNYDRGFVQYERTPRVGEARYVD